MADPVTLPNGEVGIPANQAQKYYQASWDAGLAIIKSELYSTSTDYFAIFDKKSNDAMIMARDYVSPEYTHDFTITKILQKSGIQKNEVIELIYRGFI